MHSSLTHAYILKVVDRWLKLRLRLKTYLNLLITVNFKRLQISENNQIILHNFYVSAPFHMSAYLGGAAAAYSTQLAHTGKEE